MRIDASRRRSPGPLERSGSKSRLVIPRRRPDRDEQASSEEIRVGLMGANPDRGSAAQAHIRAPTSLSGDFEITALSTSRRGSADAASKPLACQPRWTTSTVPPDRITVVLRDEALGS
jgi:hypothetical protein